MPMIKYKVLVAPVEDGVTSLPVGATPIGIKEVQVVSAPDEPPSVRFIPSVVFVMKYEDYDTWVKRYPEELNLTVVGASGEEAGAGNAQ